jgi:hypothetical protein
MKLLKVFNPIIYLINMINYFGHLETYRNSNKYEPYNFEKDMRYF